MIRLFFTACIISFCFTKVVAQKTSGYMGKRFVTGYGLYASPGFVGSGGETPLNILHEGWVEYATAKKFMVGFSARFYNAVYSNGRNIDATRSYYYSNANSYSSYSQTFPSPAGTYDIKAKNYMLYGKVFSGNYLAPWGRYFMFGATFNTFKSTYDPSKMYVELQEYGSNYDYKIVRFSNFGPKEQSFSKFDISFGFGRSKIYGNRIVIDYGYNMNLFAMALVLFDAPDDNILGNEELLPAEYIETTSAARIRGVNRFNFFCKVGVLLF